MAERTTYYMKKHHIPLTQANYYRRVFGDQEPDSETEQLYIPEEFRKKSRFRTGF